MKLAFNWCKQCTKFADCYPQDEGCYPGPYLLTPSCGQQPEPEPAPDVMLCGHPREAMRGGGATHWCAMCQEEANGRT